MKLILISNHYFNKIIVTSLWCIWSVKGKHNVRHMARLVGKGLILALTCGLLCLGLLAAEVHSSSDTFNSLLCLGPLIEILADISTIMM